jgi:NADH-quinone oxidoreductase subunit L
MAFFLQTAWLIPIFPLVSFIIITLTPIRKSKQQSGWLAIGMMGVSVLFALGLLTAVAQGVHVQPDGTVVVQHDEAAGAMAGEGEHGHAAEEEHGEGAAAAEGEGEAGHGVTFPDPNIIQRFYWAPAGTTTFSMGVYIDALVALTLVMVTITSGCIHLFSMGYMSAHPRQARFFSFISLFTAAMLGMVLSDNLLLFFICWEIMGLCSYLLIGFLYERPQAYRAGIKAFITTRVGDVLMMLGMAYLYTMAGSLAFGMQQGEIFNPEFLHELGSSTNIIGINHATAISLLLFAGTVGKSAQFPLHVWLPDAMEGPTPVSALIHAATMVSAGVFLVGRTYPIFQADDGSALMVVAGIGAFTAIFAALIAIAQYDIKRILAYSTLSQLGYMVAALGIGGWVAGMFHLLTHAFFKALLFLGSGSIIHAMEETSAIEKIHHHDEYAAQQTAQDIRNMGNLRKYMPWTFAVYTAGYLALAGIFPFAGFWSKDEILADAQRHGHIVVYALLAAAAFLTAFYMTRQWWLVFFGNYRGENPIEFVNPEGPSPATPHHGEQPTHDEHAAHKVAHAAHGPGESDHLHHHTHPVESHWTMVAPLVVLAFFAVTLGFINLPFAMPGGHWLSHLLGQEAAEFNIIVALSSLLIAIGGIALAWFFYSKAFKTPFENDPLEKELPGWPALHRKLFVDELYALTVRNATYALAVIWRWIDQHIFDNILNGIAHLTLFISRVNFIVDDTVLNDGPDSIADGTITTGKGVRQAQTGKVQDYLGLIFAGAVILGIIFLYGV